MKTSSRVNDVQLFLVFCFLLASMLYAVPAQGQNEGKNNSLPDYLELTEALNDAVTENNGGIFNPNKMWASIVNRDGEVVIVTKTTGLDAWPGSRVIAMQKAYTANAFSNDDLALSTANIYNAVQPEGSLYGLQHSNPINTEAAYKGPAHLFGTANDPAVKNTVGGINVFGGGLPLYDPETGEVVGGLGVSGDSSCADHFIAWRIRHALGFTKIPSGVNTNTVGGADPPADGDDNIIFDLDNGFGHPECGFGELEVDDLPSMENFE